MPAYCFSLELIEAYPDAKIILTLRDVDEWYEVNDDRNSRALLQHNP